MTAAAGGPLDLSRAGRAACPDGEASAGGSACGDRVRISLRVAGGEVVEARYAVRGCPAATAAAAWCAAHAEGPVLSAAGLTLRDCVAAIGLGERAAPCASLALDALHDALGEALQAVRLAPAARRVAVAMSGGVDSAVALLRVRAAGDEPVGLTLRLWIDDRAPDAERACCSPAAVRRARETCHALGVPHLTLDGRERFRRAIVEPFVASYLAGETPNPCTACNGSYRLDALLAAADALGAPVLATGHYARLVARGGRRLIARGRDEAKDQSYALGRVPPRVAARLRFPLASSSKAEVRREAAAAGLVSAGVKDSQDVCFLGGGDLSAFLSRHGAAQAAGAIVDEAGAELGRHRGAAAFTPGQRRGLGVAASAPLYVLRTDVARNAVVVAPLERLRRDEVELREAALHGASPRVAAKLRGRAPAVAAAVETIGEGRVLLRLAEPAYGVAAGQTAVLYDEEGVVVGSGVIA
jgi:tRNA-specific 2-thiouridylase